MKMPELKPCPFCGGEAELNFRKDCCSWFIKCTNCNARTEGWCHNDRKSGKEIYESIIGCVEDAAYAWNRRATDENV